MDDAVRAMAVRIAERAVPDEIDLAPDLVEELLAGRAAPGQAGPVHGGFGGLEMASELLTLIQAMQPAIASLASLLLMGSASTSILLNRLNLKERKERQQQPQTAATPDGRTVLELLARIEANLIRAGVAPERAAEMSRETVIALLEKPDEGSRFLDAVAARPGR